ncbi:MAG TPA: polymer-forming cytoskeletal protein [Polyangiaceae bacterium]|jgi:cytoskeletal protein CcmA (bactofilin family)|nr:polymer-forming cytoskeletal protein [Polyangiaceae bacterium]
MSDSKNSSDRKTLVEEGTQFKGSLSSNCPIEVKGRIEGDVTAPALSVALGGAVHGKVKVGEIRSQGELAGEFDADVVVLSGTIKDNTVIRAKSLEVKLASANSKMQVIFGECELEVGGEQPAAEVAARPSERPKTMSARPKTESVPPPDANGAV